MEEETVKYEPQCSSCVRFISDKSSSYVSSCGHLFCEKCFTSNDECPVCHERCDFLNLEDTNEYPDLHNCIYGTIKNHMDKMRELYHFQQEKQKAAINQLMDQNKKLVTRNKDLERQFDETKRKMKREFDAMREKLQKKRLEVQQLSVRKGSKAEGFAAVGPNPERRASGRPRSTAKDGFLHKRRLPSQSTLRARPASQPQRQHLATRGSTAMGVNRKRMRSQTTNRLSSSTLTSRLSTPRPNSSNLDELLNISPGPRVAMNFPKIRNTHRTPSPSVRQTHIGSAGALQARMGLRSSKARPRSGNFPSGNSSGSTPVAAASMRSIHDSLNKKALRRRRVGSPTTGARRTRPTTNNQWPPPNMN